MITLPDLRVEAGWRNGRDIRAGYQRGWGLEFGDLVQQIEDDPLFHEASVASRDMSVMDRAKRMNAFLIVTQGLPALASSHIIEFGSYNGGTALFFAVLLKRLGLAGHVYALDTYAGIPAADAAIDTHGKGDFSDVQLGPFREARDRLELDNLHIVHGRFEDSFPTLAASGLSFGLAHIDCDVYGGVKYAQDAVWPHMTQGGYVVYDDANVSSCMGATQALEELIMEKRIFSEQIYPHYVFRANPPE